MLAKAAWTVWALIPVVGLSYHFGPGQRAYNEDRACDLLVEAERLERRAQQAQETAYATHLVALDARRAAREAQSAEAEKGAGAASVEEDKAYQAASLAWKAAAEKLQEAQDLFASTGSERVLPVRVARSRALIRAGQITAGVGDLENVIESLIAQGEQESTLARRARDELATGYYYGARLMRAAGKPAAEWREVSGIARQNFRYLAETCGAELDGEGGLHQKNLELVLNLEQSAMDDLYIKPRPKNCPGNKDSNCEGLCKGKSKRPPRKKGDSRGAGGVGEIGAGW